MRNDAYVRALRARNRIEERLQPLRDANPRISIRGLAKILVLSLTQHQDIRSWVAAQERLRKLC